MKRTRALWLAALIFLAALLRLLFPGAAEELRTRTETALLPGVEETVTAWGRALAGREERIAALQGEGRR